MLNELVITTQIAYAAPTSQLWAWLTAQTCGGILINDTGTESCHGGQCAEHGRTYDEQCESYGDIRCTRCGSREQGLE